MRAAMLLFLSLLVATPLEAARIAGVVVDSPGAPVAGARVTAGTASATTGDAGPFDLTNARDGAPTTRIGVRVFLP